MGCGASGIKPEKVVKFHSHIRWYKSDDPQDKRLKNISAIKEDLYMVNAHDPQNGNQALHLAAQNGHTEIVKILISNNANVNGQNKGGQTALHMATTYGFREIAQMLVDAGADMNVCNHEGHPAQLGLDGKNEPIVTAAAPKGGESRAVEAS